MKAHITILCTAGEIKIPVTQQNYLVLAQREQWIQAQVCRHIRERLIAFLKYRKHAFGARSDNANAFTALNNIGYMVSQLVGKSHTEVCRLVSKRAEAIAALLPSEISKHAFWRTEILTLIQYCHEQTTNHSFCGNGHRPEASQNTAALHATNHH